MPIRPPFELWFFVTAVLWFILPAYAAGQSGSCRTPNIAAARVFATGDDPRPLDVGDFNGDGVDEVGVVRNGRWMIDSDGNRELTAHDRVFELEAQQGAQVVGDWNGDGIDDPGQFLGEQIQEDS